jgi:type IV pilus biogenesis protein CpaD/CtpE
VRRALLVAALAALLAGCGSRPPDLMVVERSGADPKANVELLVNDGGSVECNGSEHELDAERLLTARHLVDDLERQAELSIELPRGPGTQLSYRVRMEAGTIAFSDRSEGVPSTFQRLAGFTKDVIEDVCGIER